MEALLHDLSRQLASRDRKRRRSESAVLSPAPESDSASTASPEVSIHDALLDEGLRQRLKQSIDHVIRTETHNRKLIAGSTFISRMCYAFFMAVQGAKPLPYGITWTALLYISYYLVSNAYDNGPYNLDHSEGLSIREFRTVLTSLGMGPSSGTIDEEFMKLARSLTRLGEGELNHAMMGVWSKITDDPKVSLAAEGVLCPCHRANTLFSR